MQSTGVPATLSAPAVAGRHTEIYKPLDEGFESTVDGATTSE